MASWQHAAVPAPARTRHAPRPGTSDLDHKPKRPAAKRRPGARRRGRSGVAGGVAWIAAAGVLLAGIVALNVALLRLNVRLDHLNGQREQLRAENIALASALSSASSSPRIQALARSRGFVPAASITFVDLSRRAR